MLVEFLAVGGVGVTLGVHVNNVARGDQMVKTLGFNRGLAMGDVSRST